MLATSLAGALPAFSATAAAPARTASAAQPPIVANSVTSERQALMLYRRWGIDEVHVRATASGAVIRFSYRIVDVNKAGILNDKNAKPYLIVNKTRARLEVPTTEKVGQLRQTATPENGREYWMVFANTGRVARAGDHVNLRIGSFHAEELLVESAGPAEPAKSPAKP